MNKMNIDDLTLGQLKAINTLLGNKSQVQNSLDDFAIGKKVIIRTYSAGVWFGTLIEKSGNEVILLDARRMWKWWAKESISLSGVVAYGIILEKSKIAPAIPSVWLEAIEILPMVDGTAIASIEGCPSAQAE